MTAPWRLFYRIGLATALLSTAGLGILQAQWRGVRITRLGPAEGLTMRVAAVVQDQTGYLYIGGTSGLFRYDGSAFELFAHDPGDTTTIGPGEVYNLIAGSDSLIWITLRFGGLNSFNPKTREFRRYPLPRLPYFTIPTAHGLLEDADKNLWVGGHHFQLLLFDRTTEQYTAYQPEWIDPEAYGRRLSISSILQDVHDERRLWLSIVDYQHPDSESLGGYGIVSFDKASGTFTAYPNSGSIVHQDSLGNLYGVLMGGRVARFSPESEAYTDLEFEHLIGGNHMSRGIAPVKNHFWVTTAYSILRMDNTGMFEVLYNHRGDESFTFHTITVDNAGNTWIASSPGLTVVNPRDQHIRFFSLDAFNAPHRIYPGRLAYDPEKEIVYLSHSREISRNRVYRIPLHPDRRDKADYIQTPYNMYGIAIDTHGRRFFAGDGRMHVLQDNDRFSVYPELGFDTLHISSLWNMQGSKTGWIGAVDSRSFHWFHPEGIAVRTVEVRNLSVWDDLPNYDPRLNGFCFGNSGDVAYLFSSVVYRLDLKTGSVKLLHYPRTFNPYGQELTAVVEDSGGNLWVSGFMFTGKFENTGDSLRLIDAYSTHNGLASILTHELFCDHRDRIWLFNANGINCIDQETGEVRYFGVNEGLPEIEADPRQIISTPDNEIVTVNANGIIAFHPDSLWNALSPMSVPVVIKEIRINGEKLDTSVEANYYDRISVPIGKSVVDIQFQGLMYPTDEQLRYSYRLNEDGDWIDIGKNKIVTLPSLSPGDYTFQVKAGAPASQAQVRELFIHIPKPVYMRTWFILAALALLLLAVYAVYRYRIHAIKRQEAAKTEINKRIAELELKALRSQMNPHFMFNSLNSIKDYILHSEPERAAEYLSDFAHLIRMILQNSREKSISLKEELETLKLYIDLERLRFDQAFDFHCVIDDGVYLDEINIPPMLLQPYIENAIWHGLMHKKEHGNLTLHFMKNSSGIECVIDDDGIGRTRARELKSLSATRYKSMGMGITKDRIEIMNRMDSLGITVDVHDKVDPDGAPAGTRVVLNIPGI